MRYLSSQNRQEILQQFQSQAFDLIVIGGGITGAGIALDAAARGMKVALVEKRDFASGTSSKSTKLIHGGLRYLKQFEIGLVREVGHERAIVHRLAPHLTVAEKMLLPLVKGGTFGPLSTSFGLWVYDLLAGVKGEDKRRMLSKAETLQQEPLLEGRADILQGGGYYAEYRTDDARLTIENIKTAVDKGALCLNYAKVLQLLYEDGQAVGVQCEDGLTKDAFQIRGAHIVSAAGPWVDTLRKSDQSLSGKRLFLSKGVHIVVPHERFPLRHAIYFDVPDGRMIFAIPRHRATYIGTTDTRYEGPLDDIPVNQEDVDYLLRAANGMFPKVGLTVEDVESSWAGLRPLIYEEGKDASEMSRKDEIFESKSGLISIAGGKLTGYRRMAERIVNLVSRKLEAEQGRTFQPSTTRQIPLAGGPFRDGKEVDAYRGQLATQIASLGLKPWYADYLVANYGRQTDKILSRVTPENGDAAIALARAEAWFTVHHELAAKPMDFFNRRSGRLFFNLPSIEKVLEPVLKDFQAYFGWTDAQLAEEKTAVERAVYQAAHFEREGEGARVVS
ncbi:MAG: glycerol-3-phosphate dehydrogenase/oxidase [Phaeodactylibacter sp.]|nr:glycerol-3-phosphate dehydrogenase/oxidase [Phaeodactylibacter sp.]MCB9303848.1 glycerol-3-phosphate dehydrogenase/oxidase [Lewinellaceae bacterium]